jgi:hypothetical protein
MIKVVIILMEIKKTSSQICNPLDYILSYHISVWTKWKGAEHNKRLAALQNDG